jgi:Zn-dependent protease
MLASFGVYWTLWGWKFALGFVIAIYIHEMGHVAALIRYGIPASAPMFIPGLGAFVRIKQYPASPQEDAYVGLAGPIWGLGATLIAFGIYHVTGDPLYAAITHISAIINVFNLMPIAGLDGDRGFRALTQGQRILATLVLGAMWYYTGEGLMILVLIVAAARALFGKGAATLDHRTLAKFILLTVSLSLLGMWSIVKHAGTAQ